MKDPAMYQLPGEFLEVIKSRPMTEISSIFEALTQKKLSEIMGAQGAEELMRIQSQARYVQELHQFFVTEMLRK